MEDRYIELCGAIVRQAMADYKKALKKRKECERFFLSAYGQMMTAGNGERIVKICREEAEAKQQKKE